MELPKAYNPADYEKEIYEMWEKSGFFAPQKGKGQPFCVIMPPPNANGSLHVGHGVGITLEDIMIRYHRMKGEPTLWLPGADHAGFETQAVYQKKLEKEGRNWYTIPREKLYQEIMDFTLANKSIMENQLRRLGASCDWSREIFTLDKRIVKIVYQTFKKLFDDGLIYRGERIVHWCVKHQTTLSDLEVKHEEREGELTYIKYKIKNNASCHPFTLFRAGSEQSEGSKIYYIIVATTRPETMLGDTAVAVNPKDRRYKNLVGQTVILPLVGREIPIIADAAVDMKFGTGAVKVTPGHDPLDFEIAERHKLEKIQVIGQDGRMTAVVPFAYIGLKVEEARAKVVVNLEAQGLIEKQEDYKHSVAVCYKCNRLIEPLVLPQWFIKMKPLADRAMKAVKAGQVKFVTKHFEKILFHWLKNIRDWNISRQIVWGIRMPVWYCKKSKIKNQKSKIWELKIYGRDIFEAIGNGTKTIETRAGKPEGSEKYWGDFKQDDIIEFHLADERTDSVIELVMPVKKEVKKVSHFKTIDEIFKVYHPDQDYPGKSIKEIKIWWKKRPNLQDRIEKYGIWVIELADLEGQEIYVGEEPPKGNGWQQESDVFDAWFSSGQWPFATLKATGDFEKFYPTSVMETGWDILPFWVMRMMMLGLYVTGKEPFKYVYLHGMVRDKDRQKMSKSKGNVIDPLGVVDLYGADALRMALVFGVSAGNDMAISEDKIRAHRNFANKIWNASRFVLMNLGGDFIVCHSERSEESCARKRSFGLRPQDDIYLTNTDKAILKKLSDTTKKVTKYLDKFEFHLAAEEIYHFFWHEFCDKYLEEVKGRLQTPLGSPLRKGGSAAVPSLRRRGLRGGSADLQIVQSVLYKVLLDSLKMIHPFMPFVTEAVYQMLPEKKKEFLMIEKWPAKL